mmetsp:Transcript_24601/g.46687  ORF Transcript_24601/g.46687 Transcript_24601/m.46687 type:complete len:97 (+) Transcript_24601:1173-1463(+)
MNPIPKLTGERTKINKTACNDDVDWPRLLCRNPAMAPGSRFSRPLQPQACPSSIPPEDKTSYKFWQSLLGIVLENLERLSSLLLALSHLLRVCVQS